MEKTSVQEDRLGRKFGDTYSLILTEPDFERRLQSFDPNLKLMFDQVSKKWRVLEWAPDNSGWNIILTAEDANGNPKPLGDWVFTRLYVYRHNYEIRHNNPSQFFDDLIYEADRQENEIETKSSIDHMYQLLDERNEWRRAARELSGRPTSDVTAGYPKITPKTKGQIICP